MSCVNAPFIRFYAIIYLTRKRQLNFIISLQCMPARDAFKIPEAKPEYVVLLVSGLTSAIGLDKVNILQVLNTIVYSLHK